MKKILSILMIICIILLTGCSGKKLNENEEITNGDIYNSITAISKNSNMKFVNDKENRNVLKVYIPIKGEDPKKINDEFKTIINSIMNKTSSVFKQYKNLEEIEFLLLLNGKESSEAVVDYMKTDDDKFEIYVESFLKEKKEQQTMDNMNEQLKEKNQIVKVPDEDGYFEAPKLLENIKKGNIQLKSSNFKVINKNGKKIVKVNLIYKNEVLIVGVVKNIRNNIESALSDQCDEIYLTITQENPMDLYECKYVNGSWDKEVN
ncbi:hypothetical protein [Clostridium sporogenes]|uniref:hypothetical protein n=2 Tax=Clostridium sporogenes TaxID=1509 RepID=UPI0005F0503B|nr:hypothetical protein [Clostridium sporogenes]MCW6062674.1 hypothetical protein [Clostridium sporogenes]MCW6070139.1 hypothetical protein [Clostridium sporogenes]MCW6122551.1 hypothetical protein [Clostridium sporogenes]NFF79292.1 hypothetical protein [Clostridium sporogenes]NFU89327.1 hypothetical protein [Clostridium sporogenes]